MSVHYSLLGMLYRLGQRFLIVSFTNEQTENLKSEEGIKIKIKFIKYVLTKLKIENKFINYNLITLNATYYA